MIAMLGVPAMLLHDQLGGLEHIAEKQRRITIVVSDVDGLLSVVHLLQQVLQQFMLIIGGGCMQRRISRLVLAGRRHTLVLQ